VDAIRQGDQREDDTRSLIFETPPLEAPIEILGAAIVTLDVASDRPIANLAVRLCDVHPSGESLRVSYGVLNLAHRDGHEKLARLAVGERYQVRIQLNDAGSVLPAGHRKTRAIHGLLADDRAFSRKGHTADFGRHTRSAGTPAPGHRCAAVAFGCNFEIASKLHAARIFAFRGAFPKANRLPHAGISLFDWRQIMPFQRFMNSANLLKLAG
jgi:hypothetical protein